MHASYLLRPLEDEDLDEHADLLYSAFNSWYWRHGWGKDYFSCGPRETSIFYEIYNELTPRCSVAAFDKASGKMMGSCFYHPREHHVSLGIMSVHPDYANRGVGRLLVDHILAYTRSHGYKSCRLVSSAMNMDSFSLYNRAGFVPRAIYQDMLLGVPANGLAAAAAGAETRDRVREAGLADVERIGELEMDISGIQRHIDYRYAVENPRGALEALVHEDDDGALDGFLVSVKHPALNMIGPCVTRSEPTAISLISRAAERFRGEGALVCIPMQARVMVEQMYAWNAINVEVHLKEVWGHFPGFKGISMPSFLPETG